MKTLKNVKWKDFPIQEIFYEIQRGKRLKNEDHIPGNMPYVSSSAINNGIDDFVSNEEKVRMFKDCITIANSGSVGASFYHPYTFVASDHVTQLKRQNSNKYIYLIISAIWYRPYRCFGTADSRCRIFHSGGVVPLKLWFFDIVSQQRV